MIKKRFSFLFLISTIFIFSACTYSGRDQPPFGTGQLMTAQDVLNSAYSNISIRNAAGAPIVASGIYIESFDLNDCSFCSGSVIGGNNVMGAVPGPVFFPAGESIKIGQNYLYNLIYNGIYFISQNSSAPCLLPGCSWPGDNTGVTGWCLSIGVMSRNSAYTFSSYANGSHSPSNVVPFSEAVTSNPFNYKYDLIDPNTLGVGGPCIGPVVCNDETLTCTVSTPQSQSFQSY
jgi:hypothetical protein